MSRHNEFIWNARPIYVWCERNSAKVFLSPNKYAVEQFFLFSTISQFPEVLLCWEKKKVLSRKIMEKCMHLYCFSFSRQNFFNNGIFMISRKNIDIISYTSKWEQVFTVYPSYFALKKKIFAKRNYCNFKEATQIVLICFLSFIQFNLV